MLTKRVMRNYLKNFQLQYKQMKMSENEKEAASDDWSIDCSDDEKYEVKSKWVTIGDMLVPPAEDIASLHEVLCMDRLIALEWQYYGRRPPTPEQGQVVQQEVKEKMEDKSDDFFDFDMDDMTSSQPKLPVRRREGELKGGARKKTTSFDGIISNMKRHWKLDNESQS